MKACILNSGIGKRMGELTEHHPKCMVEIADAETILSRQLSLISACGVSEVVITTGPFSDLLYEYADSVNRDRKLGLSIRYVWNEIYSSTNYIYSLFLAREELKDDILLMHGDLVYEKEILEKMLELDYSVMTISSTLPLPEKDFKAVIVNERIQKVGIEFFDQAYAAQPLYKLTYKDWMIWLDKIADYCEQDVRSCYAENALNEVTDRCWILPYDVRNQLCNEIDNMDDLNSIRSRLIMLS